MRSENLIGALALIGAAAMFNAGCVAHASAGAEAEVQAPVVFVAPPTLVEIDSDVYVVQDYDYPVYYTGGFYWAYRDGLWYRATEYDGAWATVEVSIVPVVVVHRDHRAYVHYHGTANAHVREAPGRGHVAASPSPAGPAPAANNGPPPNSAAYNGPPGHNDPPGVGNQRKAAGEQPGEPKGEPKGKKYDNKKKNKK